MALRQSRTADAAAAAADAVTALADDGFLRIYGGSQPANADTSVTGQTLLAELVFGSPAFEPSDEGVSTATVIADEDSAVGTGTATWFRVLATDGLTALWDGSVGTSGANLNMDDTQIALGDTVSVTALTYAEARAAFVDVATFEFVGDGATDTFTVDPWDAATVRVFVDGLDVVPDSLSPTTGAVTLASPPADGAVVVVEVGV